MENKDRIKSVFTESIGGMTGFDPKTETTPELQKHKDVRRKKIERQSEQRENRLKRHQDADKAVKKGLEPPHPRTYLDGEMRLTLKECFGTYLAGYLNTGKSMYMKEAFQLLNEYPKLMHWVQKVSHEALPKNAFSVYSAREHLDEEVGSPAYRVGSNPHNWCLTKHQLMENVGHLHHPMIIESKITPDKVLVYIPAFTKLLEHLIHSGKIEEPQENIVRKARLHNEVVLPPSIDSGIVVHIEK